MIELKNDSLVFSFPEVHPDAKLRIDFQRTLRIPDDDRVYPLPPGLGSFPLVHVDDYHSRVPPNWVNHGGTIMPMYQAEAMWIHFDGIEIPNRNTVYPFALKISTGKIDAITGEQYSDGLHRVPQNYAVVPGQPWLDGYCVKKGIIRQFVAMPLGEGYTAEEQLNGKAEFGGLQIVAYPMKANAFEKRFPIDGPSTIPRGGGPIGCLMRGRSEMGLAPGGQMRQEIYRDEYDFDEWDTRHHSRCFVHITNSIDWYNITGKNPPQQPPSASDYSQAGLPWFDYYGDLPTLTGQDKLANLKSAQAISKSKGESISNESIAPENVVKLGPNQVREGEF